MQGSLIFVGTKPFSKSMLSKSNLFSSASLTAPAGAGKPQIVVQSATDTDSDGSRFDPLHYI